MKFLFQHAPATPVTRVIATLPRTGACLDPPHQRGLTRMTTRLMFQGAGGLSNDELNSRLERLGATMGCSLSNDTISFRLMTLTENLDAALELFRLTIHEPNFDQTEFERLQGELTSSWIAEREESKHQRAQDAYMNCLYAEAPTGYMPDGTLEGLRACTPEDTRQHYRKLFSKHERVIAVMSDLPQEQTKKRVLDLFSMPEFSNGGQVYPWDDFQPPEFSGRHVIILPDTDPNTNEIIAGGFSALEREDDWHIHRIISFVFGGDMNSRLFRILRGEHGFTYGASCWYESAQGRTPRDQLSPFSLYTFPAAEHTARALPMLFELYEELVSNGVTEQELDLARKSLTLSYPFLRDTPQKLLSLQIGEALYGIPTDDDKTNREKIASVTREEIHRVLKETHHPENLCLVLLGDQKHLEPMAGQLSNVVDIKILNDSLVNPL